MKSQHVGFSMFGDGFEKGWEIAHEEMGAAPGIGETRNVEEERAVARVDWAGTVRAFVLRVCEVGTDWEMVALIRWAHGLDPLPEKWTRRTRRSDWRERLAGTESLDFASRCPSSSEPSVPR